MRKRVVRLLGAGALVLVPACLFAGFGFESSRGPDDFKQNAMSLDVPVARSVTFGLGYSQYTSSGAAFVNKTLTMNADANIDDHWGAGFMYRNSPEVNGYRAYGWGINGYYDAGFDPVNVVVSAGLTKTKHEEFTGTVGRRNQNKRWISVGQNSFEPSVTVSFFSRVSIRGGVGLYGYDQDINQLTARLETLSLRNTMSGILNDVIDGFPARTTTAGVAVSLPWSLRLSCDGSRVVYATDHPAEDSVTVGAGIALVKHVEINGSVNTVAGRDRYFTLGMRWNW